MERSALIIPLQTPEILTIDTILKLITKHFSYDYHIGDGSKLPVLAIYAVYQILCNEFERYQQCELRLTENHTASNRTSRNAADIEITKNGQLFEAIEIKHDKKIDATLVRIVRDKIHTYNPQRYYILSDRGIVGTEEKEINTLIQSIRETHGCQVILNGILPTLKYYLRLIRSLPQFIHVYSGLIEKDTELKMNHKSKWNELLQEVNH